eukprot:UN31524
MYGHLGDSGDTLCSICSRLSAGGAWVEFGYLKSAQNISHRRRIYGKQTSKCWKDRLFQST